MRTRVKRKRTDDANALQALRRRLETLIRNVDELQLHEIVYGEGLDHHMNDALQSIGEVLDNLPKTSTMERV